MKRHPVFVYQKLNIVKMTTLPRLRFSATPIKKSAGFFAEIEKLSLNSIGIQGAQNSQTIF